MSLIESIRGIAGIYVLSPKGKLGLYTDNHQWITDHALSEALAAPIGTFLGSYRATRTTERYRLGIIHPHHTDKPWDTDTIVLENHVLRKLFPSPTQHGPLTNFQRQNREQSVYRAMEKLMDFRNTNTPQLPQHCPVLVYRGMYYDDYAQAYELPPLPGMNSLPVMEVIDLLTGMADHMRIVMHCDQLNAKMHKLIVHPEKRTRGNIVMLDEVRDPPANFMRASTEAQEFDWSFAPDMAHDLRGS